MKSKLLFQIKYHNEISQLRYEETVKLGYKITVSRNLDKVTIMRKIWKCDKEAIMRNLQL